jgi:Outer membrane protein beta-barrel domain
MKKLLKLSLVFVFFGLASSAFAQLELAVGLKGGLNFASLNASSSVSANYKNRTGYNAGAFVLFKFTKVAIQGEVLYSTQGSTVTVPTSTQSFNNEFNYVNIPILFKLYTIAGINIQVGPQFGFLTNSPAYQSLSSGSVTTVQDAYKKSDLSLAMGLGWDLPFGLSIDARYNLGLSEIQASNNPDVTKNQVFQVSVGYKLIKLGH